MTKTVLVIGAPGFIGRNVTKAFSGAGFSVTGIGIESPENAPLNFLERYYSFTLPSSHAELAEVVGSLKPAVCIHCAGRASVPYSLTDPAADFHSSVDVTFEILNTLRLHSPSTRLILLSSAAVYGNPERLPIVEDAPLRPISPYGFHKRMCEELCEEFSTVYGIPTAVARIFSAYGPGLRRQVVWDLCSRMLTATSIGLQGTGAESRDFIHVNDVARGILLLAEKARCEGEAYNLANGAETRIDELADMIRQEANPSVIIQFDGVIPAGTPLNWRADISRLASLGFVPEMEISRGIRHFVQWCRAEIEGK